MSNLVYSTEVGRTCPACRKAISACICPTAKQAGLQAVRSKLDGVVRVQLESKGRGGKSVSIVRGLDLDEAALTALGKQLRTACGSGGTIKNGAIEVQGDHVATLMQTLTKLGHAVKRVGG